MHRRQIPSVDRKFSVRHTLGPGVSDAEHQEQWVPISRSELMQPLANAATPTHADCIAPCSLRDRRCRPKRASSVLPETAARIYVRGHGECRNSNFTARQGNIAVTASRLFILSEAVHGSERKGKEPKKSIGGERPARRALSRRK